MWQMNFNAKTCKKMAMSGHIRHHMTYWLNIVQSWKVNHFNDLGKIIISSDMNWVFVYIIKQGAMVPMPRLTLRKCVILLLLTQTFKTPNKTHILFKSTAIP